MSQIEGMIDFLKFLNKRVFITPDKYFFDEDIIDKSIYLTIMDVNYHFPSVSENEIIDRVYSNKNELAIFLYRLGNEIYKINDNSRSLSIIHSLMKDLCSCELFYSTDIDIGFYIVHGEGTVIGSRNQIGKGFKIYQNCTIGQRNNLINGNIIGDNVTCFAGSKILGENRIGNNVKIGANTLVTNDIPNNRIVYGNPNKLKII